MTNLKLVFTKELYHCYYFRSMKKNVCVTCSVIPLTAVTAIWQLEVITDVAKCQLSILTLNAPILKMARHRVMITRITSGFADYCAFMYFVKNFLTENSELKYNFKLNSY